MIAGVWSLFMITFLFALWVIGGWLIAISTFELRQYEYPIIGFSIGIILSIWIANLLAQILSVLLAFWVAAVFPLLLGLLMVTSSKRQYTPILVRFPFELIFLILLFLLITAIGRGLGIFDEFQNLPLVSLLASGDIPPHFPLNSSLTFDYHYYQLLLGAFFMRVAKLYPWLALDVAHALTISVTILISYLFARRISHSFIAGILSAFLVSFADGIRWVFLLLPNSWLENISTNVKMIGTAGKMGTSFAQAMHLPILVEGSGPLPFAFAFASGIRLPLMMAFDGRGASGSMIFLTLLITVRTCKEKWSSLITILLVAALAQADEIMFVLLLLGCLILFPIWWFGKKPISGSTSILRWVIIMFGALTLSALQGGVFTRIIKDVLNNSHQNGRAFFSLSFQFIWPPALVSSQLGILHLDRPINLLLGLLEIGPLIFVIPLLIAWLFHKIKRNQWGEAMIISGGLASLGTIFVLYNGTGGIRNTSRFFEELLLLCQIYIVPMSWLLLRRKKLNIHIPIIFLLFMMGLTTMGGLNLFWTELKAIPTPVLSPFIEGLDAQMTRDYWNKLPVNALIFDPIPYRAPTIFARYTNSSYSWYQTKPEWNELVKSPDPFMLNKAGYNFVYVDKHYVDSLETSGRLALESSCVYLVKEYTRVSPSTNYSDYRRLLDIRACHAN